MMVWFVLEPHHGDSHTQRSRSGGRTLKDGKGVSRVAMGVPGVAMSVPVGLS